MEQESQTNQDVPLPLPEIDPEALSREPLYIHAESVDYYAYELETRQEAWAPTREEALARLKEAGAQSQAGLLRQGQDEVPALRPQSFCVNL